MAKREIKVIRKWYSFTAVELGKAFVIAAIILLIIYAVASNCWPKRYYLSDIQLCRTTVEEKQQEDGKYYIRVGSSGITQPIGYDNLWFEVKKDFYDRYSTGNPVAISIAKCDTYQKNLLNGRLELGSSSWETQEIYGSYEDAQQANQYKKFSSEAVLAKKKKTGDGHEFFVLEKDDRNFTLIVDDPTFNRYSEKQNVKCIFESIGEYVKLIGIEG